MLALMRAGGTYTQDLNHLGDQSFIARLEQEVACSTTASLSPEPEVQLNILSASTYNEVLQINSPDLSSNPPRSTYGDSCRKQLEPPQKRTREGASNSSLAPALESIEGSCKVNKKQRGRPRVSAQDETPQQRRRTQIRLAQRNYRQRKETTITELKERVTALQELLGNMNKSFVQLHDNLQSSGILSTGNSNDRVSHQLQRMMEMFTEVSKQFPEDDTAFDDGSVWRERVLGPLRSYTPSDEAYASGSGTAYDLTAPNSRSESTTGCEHIGMSSKPRAITLSEISEVESRLFALVEPYRRLPLEKPISPSATFTYSFQETTFARRLQRQTLERAYQFLSDPSSNPGLMSRVFRFSFTFTNRERMLDSIKSILTRPAGETLENLQMPFLGIGGAGMHFPRYDENGFSVSPINTVNPAVILGPLELPNAEYPRPERRIEEILEAIGFGGEWFDSYDVEEYLKSRGLFLDAQSSFVAFYPDASFTYRQEALAHESTRKRVPSAPRSVPNGGQLNCMSSDMQHNAGWPQSQLSATWDVERVPSPRYLTLDVDRFTSSVVDRCVCLGRAPGFRKSNVEKSLHLAIQEAF